MKTDATRAILVLALILAAGGAPAQFVDPKNVLVQNVHLVDTGQADGSVLVNILIGDNELKIVSEDPIPAEDMLTVVDARNGFLMGKLEIGQPPSFIILDTDPGADIEVLLDTRRHTIFAIHDGRLLRNSLYGVAVAAAPSPTEGGWRAYTPPPMALPLSYRDETKWNRFETKAVSGIFVVGAVLDRQRTVSQDAEIREQFGDVGLFDGGEIRGFRLGAVGTINFKKPWIYTVFGATNAFDKGFETDQLDSFQFFDYRLDIPIFDSVNVSIGSQKEPFSIERVMSMLHLPMQERTAGSDAMLPSRNFGIRVNGTALDERMTWAGGVFNDWITAPGSFSENSTESMGRLTWLPYLSDDESELVHLGFGVRYSNAREGLRYRSEPEFNKLPDFVDTGDQLSSVDSTLQYSVEAGWRDGPLMMFGEYLETNVDAPALGNPNLSSFFVTGSWILTGEMHRYQKQSGIFHSVPVARSVYQGGRGSVELGFRYSSVDLVDGLVDGGEMDISSLGLNWWLTPFFQIGINFRHVTLDRSGLEGSYGGFNSRVVLLLE